VARWSLIAVGLYLTLARATSIRDIQIQTTVILALTVMNFFLHGRILMGKPVRKEIVYLASAADIAVISLLIGTTTGFKNNFFVFYYPAVLAFSLVFPPTATLTFTGAVLFAYTMISLFTKPGLDVAAVEEKILIARLLTITAVAVVGTMYWRVERARRRAAVEAQAALLQQDVPPPAVPGSQRQA